MSAIADPERTVHPLAIELNFAAPAIEEVNNDGKTEFWTDILREGEIKTTPGQVKKVPFTVVADGPSSSTRRVISFSDIIKGFDAKAFGEVTIPDGHPKPDRVEKGKLIKGDSALNNTGYVRGLRVVQKDVNLGDTVLKDCHVLQADMGFTEPDAAAKAKRGSIPNVSSGIFFDFVRKADDRYFPCALNHVALTKNPWITGLEGFPKAFFGDDLYQEGVEFEFVNLDDAGTTEDKDAKVIWSDKNAADWIARQLGAALNPKDDEERDPLKPYTPRAYYYVEGVTHNEPNLARVEESFKGKTTSYVVPYTVNDDGVPAPAPSTRWIEGRTAMIAASDDSTGDQMANFARHSHGKLRERLGIALSDLLGDGPAKALVIEETSTEGQALLRNKDNGGVYLADFRDCGGPLYFSESSSWETIKAPGTSTNKETTKVVASTTPTFDLSTPEGRVAARRHTMRQR